MFENGKIYTYAKQITLENFQCQTLSSKSNKINNFQIHYQQISQSLTIVSFGHLGLPVTCNYNQPNKNKTKQNKTKHFQKQTKKQISNKHKEASFAAPPTYQHCTIYLAKKPITMVISHFASFEKKNKTKNKKQNNKMKKGKKIKYNKHKNYS